MSIREAAREARLSLCEETLEDLSIACREIVKQDSGPIEVALALCHLWGKMSWSLHDRPVHTSEIATLSDRLGGLLGILETQGVSEESREAVVQRLEELRDLA